MKIRVTKQNLNEGIAAVSKAISSKTTMPILEGIYIEATKDGLILKGSDMDISIETFVAASVEKVGSVVIDAKIFSEVVRKLPDSQIVIEIADSSMITISCEKSVFNIAFMDSSDYPAFPEIKENVEVAFEEFSFKQMVKGVSFAVAVDEARPILQGVLLQLKDNKFNMVALDGYRMAIRNEVIDSSDSFEVVIPGKSINEICKLLGDTNNLFTMKLTSNHVLFNIGVTKVYSRLLDGKFVNYSALVPADNRVLVNVNASELVHAIERASLMAKDGNTNLIKIEIKNNEMEITSNSQMGKSRELVTVDKHGEDITIAFNSRYLTDILKNIQEDEIVMELTSSVSPCIIKKRSNNTALYLVLPVRITR